jgi:hypothetical protein
VARAADSGRRHDAHRSPVAVSVTLLVFPKRHPDTQSSARAGAFVVSDLPEGLTTIACAACGRLGRYRAGRITARTLVTPLVGGELGALKLTHRVYDPLPNALTVQIALGE